MKNIPFFANLPDGTHCYQAALKMVLTHFSGEDFSFEKLDQLTGKLPGKWTWPTQSLIWLLDHGYEIRLIEEFSFEEFAKRGRDYIVSKWGEDVAKAQEANSDLLREQKLAELFSTRCPVDYRSPSWEDIEELFQKNFLLVCNINACGLYQQAGYSGHFVVLTEVSSSHITIHDPGLPPQPALKVERAVFEKAWGYPSEHERNILAIKMI
ncbi:MAG: hypothetical protein Q7T03_02040 [Deltaproteobacteria bacterium]|nr:hypothetical protein [Deltaproteobacteria bacterium]